MIALILILLVMIIWCGVKNSCCIRTKCPIKVQFKILNMKLQKNKKIKIVVVVILIVLSAVLLYYKYLLHAFADDYIDAYFKVES